MLVYDDYKMDKINVEVEVISWLNTFLTNGWKVFGDKPSGSTQKYVLVDRTGGPREHMVLDRASILIEVYHKDSRLDASELANTIADRIIELTNVHNITKASINSLINLDDVVAQYSRYQIYCDISVRR